jgi:uncharacterized protein YnzC (UPF0291/DUF896 family)
MLASPNAPRIRINAFTARQNRTAREQLTEKNSQDLQSLRQQLLQKQKAQQQKLQSNINKIGGQPEQGTAARSGVGLSLDFVCKNMVLYTLSAGMAELADAPDLGSGGRPCRFKSCYPH